MKVDEVQDVLPPELRAAIESEGPWLFVKKSPSGDFDMLTTTSGPKQAVGMLAMSLYNIVVALPDRERADAASLIMQQFQSLTSEEGVGRMVLDLLVERGP
ncbi:MAG TPA: hypothetical protein VK524_34525 [Polyangiaceae bacterium]|nr:hypothetical protein [Polyangiaceae bacterium]